MSVRSFYRGFLPIALLALQVSTGVAVAADDNDPNTGVVNCGDTNQKDACFECCTTPTCFGKISCCPLVGSCEIVDKPSSAPPPLKLKMNVGGLNLQFSRKIKPSGVDVRLKVRFLQKVFPVVLNMKAKLTGDDARIGGLLQPLAFLRNGDVDGATLQTKGYSVDVEGSSLTCQELFPDALCFELAAALSRSIYGSLVGTRSELDAFLSGALALGNHPCEIGE